MVAVAPDASAAAVSPAAKRRVLTKTGISPAGVTKPMLAMEMGTPVARKLMATTPPLAAMEPQAGCSLEDLRVFVLEQLKTIKADSADLEVRAAVRINEVQSKVDDVSARTDRAINDVGVFGTVKHFVTEAVLQAQMEKVEHTLKMLQAQGNDFVAVLGGHLIQIEGIETEFKGHVNHNFLRVENDCKTIMTALEGVSASGGTTSGLVAQRVVAIELALQKEVATINGNLQQLKSGIGSVPLLISSAVGAITPAKCHCVHVDQLGSRVAMLEAAANATAVQRDV